MFNILPTTIIYPIYLPCIKKFGLPPCVCRSADRNVNDEECLLDCISIKHHGSLWSHDIRERFVRSATPCFSIDQRLTTKFRSFITHHRSLQFVCLLVACLTSQQHASVSQGRICSDNCTCCHTEMEVADQTFHLSQSQYTDTGPTSPSTNPITPGSWHRSHWRANFEVTGMTRPEKIPAQVGFEPGIFRSRDGHLKH